MDQKADKYADSINLEKKRTKQVSMHLVCEQMRYCSSQEAVEMLSVQLRLA
jgi:hypothetical protein